MILTVYSDFAPKDDFSIGLYAWRAMCFLWSVNWTV